MRNLRSFAFFFILMVLVAGLAACQTPAGRSAGQVLDDATITAKVKAKLLDDPLVSGLAIDVDTFQGEVTLTGVVHSPKARIRAEDLARKTRGVRSVRNLIRIQP
ncbi:BON domain-containing protein [Desulfacinum hydrothermale DSM 13146]|uniref:BON domain-containing protein n=1 Tax=Desulfacinum hydrothermale DSM 13146 TaxID=1121390 RepID=A0A1W1XGJ5_9BACT|nr:BON domain-containing protein [Desulfacinum hydrothermale]SMC23070.1 BON domain-containing protein [Desulfacinum hydrothermale DSM 13146]